MTQMQLGLSGMLDGRKRQIMSSKLLSSSVPSRKTMHLGSQLVNQTMPRHRRKRSLAVSDLGTSSWTVVVAMTAMTVWASAQAPATASRMEGMTCFATTNPLCVGKGKGPFSFSNFYSTVTDTDTVVSSTTFAADEKLAHSFAEAAASFEGESEGVSTSPRYHPNLLWSESSRKEVAGIASPYRDMLSEKVETSGPIVRPIKQRMTQKRQTEKKSKSFEDLVELARRGRIEMSQATGQMMKTYRRNNNAEALRRRRVLQRQRRGTSMTDAEVSLPHDGETEECLESPDSLSAVLESSAARSTRAYVSERTMPGFQRRYMRKESVEKRRQVTKVPQKIQGSGKSKSNMELELSEEIRKIPMLSLEEEIRYGNITQKGLRYQRLFDSLSQKLHRPPTAEEWCEAAGESNLDSLEQTIEEGLEAKGKLVRGNLRMVRSVVDVYMRNGIGSEYDVGDLIQEGTLALIRAAEKFEPSRGHRFSTYAMYWIRSTVKKSQLVQSRLIRVPEQLLQKGKRVEKAERKLRAILGRRATKEELAKEARLKVSEVTRIQLAQGQIGYSFDVVVTNKKSPNSINTRAITLADMLSNTKDDEEELRNMNQRLLKEDLVRILNEHLSSHYVDLVLLRFGLMDENMVPREFSGRQLSIQKVSELVGLPPILVRRMLDQSLRKLRPVLEKECYELLKISSL